VFGLGPALSSLQARVMEKLPGQLLTRDNLRSMQIAQNQVDAGIVSRVDLVQAQTQYEQTRAQLVNESINRALLEHAIALLVGKAPSEVTIEPAPTRLTVPTVESGVPSSLLERRPERGIWGGLWCLPEFDTESAARAFAQNHLRALSLQPRSLGTVRHSFTHYDLEILPVLAECAGFQSGGVMEPARTLWYNPSREEGRVRIGLPAPIKELLETLTQGIR
jgi:hypothetical protein